MSAGILILLCCLLVRSEKICTWYKHEEDAGKCVPHSGKQCKVFSATRPNIRNDEYTLEYFDSYACKQPCINFLTESSCGADPKQGCYWINDRLSPTLGHCRGGAAHTYIQNLIGNGKPIKREALYSYSINAYDCRSMCETSALGFTKDTCTTLKYCCKEAWDGRCTVDFVNIANRYSPAMLPIARLEMFCRSKENQAACDGDYQDF